MPATVPSQVERIQAAVTHAHGGVLPWGVRSAPRLAGKSLALAETPPPCPRVAEFDPAASTLSSVLKHQRKGV